MFVIDQDLVVSAVETLVIQALTAYKNGVQISWQDAELAAYLVYTYGEVNKSVSSTSVSFFPLPADQTALL